MKLRNLALLTILGAGSLQASLIVSATGLTPGGSIFFQDFSTALTGSLPAQQAALPNPTDNPPNYLFSYVDITSSNGTLYYDPNGSNGCAQGGGSGHNINATLSACIGTYDETSTSQTMYNPGVMGTAAQDFTIKFDQTVYQTSFVLSGPGSTSPSSLVYVTLHLANGGTEVDPVHLSFGASGGPYMIVSNAAGINSIEITQDVVGTATTGTYNTNNTLNLVVGDIAGNTVPEPATMGLLGLGLAGIGYFARRRKTA